MPESWRIRAAAAYAESVMRGNAANIDSLPLEKPMKIPAILISLLLACSAYGQPNTVTDWAVIVQPAINNSAAPQSPASSQVLHTLSQTASAVQARRFTIVDRDWGSIAGSPRRCE